MSLEVMLLIAVVFVHTGSDAHNILVAVSHPGVSHFKSYENLFLCLAKKGHNVTVISHFPQKKLIRNYRDISIREDIPYRGLMDMNSSFKYDILGIKIQKLLLQFAVQSCESMKHINFQKFVKENNQFDLVIINEFSNLCYRGQKV
ncbi:unnamed protein product [Acanthoscelides obtectus]|uniref:Ecdysteroid UDP-glucosyltransferase n=1 Tax=Acanthoscelides obtectus TaxID=200917 RepID=A0A9P0L825_ACAOB|nr:unnamed protein product [Acanthoscelides obtectus]CAK1668677.1 hypothetical protein AOBTE_LOCUS26531 [Acanthoscelides obtectus]